MQSNKVTESAKTLVLSNGIPTTDILNNKCFPGIMGKPEAQREAAAADPKNYVTTVGFPIASVDKTTGKFINSYEKDGQKAEGHAVLTAQMPLNIATYTDFDDSFAGARKNAGSQLAEDGKAVLAKVASAKAGGMTQFSMDLAEIAKQNAADRKAAGSAARNIDEKRLNIQLEPQTISKNGVGAVSVDTARGALTQIAASAYLMQNSKTKDAADQKGQFDAKTIDAIGKKLETSFNSVMKDIVENGKNGIPAMKGAQNGQEIDGTSIPALKNIQIVPVEVEGATVYGVKAISNDDKAVRKETSDLMKAAGARANATLSQNVNGGKGAFEKGTTEANIGNAVKFTLNAVPMKNSDGKSADVTVVSPKIGAKLSPYATKVTQLNDAVKQSEVGGAAKVLGQAAIDSVEKMAADVVSKDNHLSKDAYNKAHDETLKAVKSAVDGFGNEGASKGKKGPSK